MALKQNQGRAAEIDRADRPAPVIPKADLRDHLREPAVAVRMKRVNALVAERAQQNS